MQPDFSQESVKKKKIHNIYTEYLICSIALSLNKNLISLSQFFSVLLQKVVAVYKNMKSYECHI